MTKDLLLTRIAAIVTSIEDGTPESMLYIFCEMNMDDWLLVRGILIDSRLVTIKGHYVTLTSKGRETAKQLNDVIAARQN